MHEVTSFSSSRPVIGVGSIKSFSSEILSSPESGRVAKILVERGEDVNVGEPLIVLDNPDLFQELKEAEFSATEIASAAAFKLAELNQQKFKLKSQKINIDMMVESNKLEMEALEELKTLGVVSRIKFKQQKLKLDQTLLEQKNLVDQSNLYEQSYQEQVIALDAKKHAAEEKVRYYQDRTELLTVRASRDGVVKDINLNLGQVVQRGERLAILSDLDNVYAEVLVPQYESHRIEVGDQATLTGPAGRLEGEVTFIDPIVRNGASTIKIDLLNASHSFNIDQTIEASIIPNEVEKVAKIKKPDGFEEIDHWTVYKKVGDKIIKTEITLSAKEQGYLVLSADLNSGEYVVLLPSNEADKQEYKL